MGTRSSGVGKGWGASLASLTYVPRTRTLKNTSGSCDTKGRSGQNFLLIICFSLSIDIYIQCCQVTVQRNQDEETAVLVCRIIYIYIAILD